jgi:ATP-binding cassette subfamily B protein/ATP-binding cassette subfamily C protein LapB
LELANIKDLSEEELKKYSSKLLDDEDVSVEDPQKVERYKDDTLLLSLKKVLDFYYGDISIETILNFTHQSEETFTHNMAVEICFSMGLNAVYKEMKASEIAQYFLPCIIIDKQGEAFVYTTRTMREAKIFNPKTKETITHPISELKKFQRVVLIFRDQKKSEYIDIDKSKDWFWKPVKSFWRKYIEIGMLTFFINLFGIAMALFTMNVYNRVIPNNATETLFVLAGGVLLILLFDLFFKSVRNHIIEQVNKNLGIYFEDEMMKRMLHVRSSFDTMLTGMKADLFRELNQVKSFFSTQSIVNVIDLPFFFVAMGVIYLINPYLAVIPLIVAIIIIVFNIFMQIPIEKLSKDRLKNQQTKQNYLVELIRGGEMVKLSNASPTKLFNWRNIVAFQDSITNKIQSLNVFSLNFSQTFMQIITVLVIIVGVYEIAANRLTVGGLIAVNILVARAMVPVIHLSLMTIKFKEIKESLNNINDFWHLPLETDKQIEVGIGKLKGEIEFKNVEFYYKDSKYASVDKINFKIQAGEKVGIIGQTGAGKSTILRMITGLDVPSKGSIFIDGHDISTVHPIELRQNIGVMPQEPFLFSGTLKENIELSHPVSKARMMEVIKMTGLEDLVKKTGQGDGLQVGENGNNLSVGQRHLVAMGRAIVNDPSILILDEPTTGLDIGLEKALVSKMKELVEEKTVIVITHRFTALDLVDRVIILAEGKIVADGPKDKILAALQGKK